MSSRSPNRIGRHSPTRHSPPPPPISTHPPSSSHSPLRGAIPLVMDSDDDSDDDDDDSGIIMDCAVNNPPELASTCSSSNEGTKTGAVDNNPPSTHHHHHHHPAPAETTTSALTHQAVEEMNKKMMNSSSGGSKMMNNHHHNGGTNNSNNSIANSSGIGNWRRRDMQIATMTPSSFSLLPAAAAAADDVVPPSFGSTQPPNNNHNHNNNNNNNNNNQHYNSNNSIPITPLHQIPYVHGGYAAAAPLFVTHSKFASILKKLLPGAYGELSCLLRSDSVENGSYYRRGKGGSGNDDKGSSNNNGGKSNSNNNKTSNSIGQNTNNNFRQEKRRLLGVQRLPSCSPTYQDVISSTSTASGGSSNNSNGGGGNNNAKEVVLVDPVKVMKWAENNPVVSAFGIWNSDSGRRTIKFMRGINLHNKNNTNNNTENRREQYGISSCNDDRESVVTIGSNGNYCGYNTTHNHLHNGRPYAQRSRRRKHPLPDDVPNSNTTTTNTNTTTAFSSDHHSSTTMYGGIEISTGIDTMMIPPRPSYNKPALEWDVFLDPNLVRQVDAAMGVVDNLELKLRKARIKRDKRRAAKSKLKQQSKQQYPKYKVAPSNHSKNHSNAAAAADDEEDEETINDDDFDILQSHTAAQVEVDRLVSQLMRRTIIAHGSMSQLVLEAMGVAPKYNFGTVVKSSREGGMGSVRGGMVGGSRSGNNHPTTPSRSMKRVSLRAGNTEFSLNMTQTLSWDEEEELRDFEALLDPSILGSGTDGKKGGGQSDLHGKQRTTATTTSTSSTQAGSKGMFMETWIHVFAQTLSLLVKSGSNSNDNGVRMKGSSSSSRGSHDSNDGGGGGERNQLAVKNRPANIGQRGLSGLLEKMFLRRDSSFPDPVKYFGSSTAVVDESNFDCTEEKNEAAINNNNINNKHRHRQQLASMEYDDDNSELLTNNDMFSPQTPTTSSFYGNLCGMSLCLGYEGNDSSKSSFPLNPHASHKMAQDIERISCHLGEPLRLVLDLKSRRVPPRVWSRLIDSLRTRGLIIEGIGSFDVDELRVIGKGCSYPLTPILFFHSVGDLQRACHANEVKKGDTVYFNGGSLMWKRSSIMEAAQRGCCGAIETDIGGDDVSDGMAASGRSATRAGSGGGNYSFQPYAYPRSALSDWERVMCKSTIEDYRRHFNLKIGVYVQEFSISAEALDVLSIFVNKHGNVYDQGLAFGGVNGTAVRNIHGDGYWNQRYMGRSWDFDARPSNEMTPLKPEDHHLVQKAIQAGAWGQVGTIYEVMDEKAGALTVPPPREPCNMVNTF